MPRVLCSALAPRPDECHREQHHEADDHPADEPYRRLTSVQLSTPHLDGRRMCAGATREAEAFGVESAGTSDGRLPTPGAGATFSARLLGIRNGAGLDVAVAEHRIDLRPHRRGDEQSRHSREEARGAHGRSLPRTRAGRQSVRDGVDSSAHRSPGIKRRSSASSVEAQCKAQRVIELLDLCPRQCTDAFDEVRSKLASTPAYATAPAWRTLADSWPMGLGDTASRFPTEHEAIHV